MTANELLQYVWVIHRIVARGQSIAFSHSLGALATQHYPPEPVGNGEAGYDSSAEAVWIRRRALKHLTKDAMPRKISDPSKNLFAHDKNIVTKLGAFAKAPDPDVIKDVQRAFEERPEDVSAFTETFGGRPVGLTFRGFPVIGWGVPPNVYCIGLVDDGRVWRLTPEKRSVVIQQRVIRMPLSPYYPWESGPRTRDVEPEVMGHYHVILREVIRALSGEGNATTREPVERTTLVEGSSLPWLPAPLLFWYPPLGPLGYLAADISTRLSRLLRALGKPVRSATIVLCVNVSSSEVTRVVVSFLAKHPKLVSLNVLVLGPEELSEYLEHYPWIVIDRFDWEKSIPVMSPAAGAAYADQVLTLFVLRELRRLATSYYRSPMPMAVVGRVLKEISPAANMESALGALVDTHFVREVEYVRLRGAGIEHKQLWLAGTGRYLPIMWIPGGRRVARSVRVLVARWLLQNRLDPQIPERARTELMVGAAAASDRLVAHENADDLRSVVAGDGRDFVTSHLVAELWWLGKTEEALSIGLAAASRKASLLMLVSQLIVEKDQESAVMVLSRAGDPDLVRFVAWVFWQFGWWDGLLSAIGSLPAGPARTDIALRSAVAALNERDPSRAEKLMQYANVSHLEIGERWRADFVMQEITALRAEG